MPKTTNPGIYRPIDVPDRLSLYVRRAVVADTAAPVDMDVDVRATGYHYLGWVWRGRWQGLVNGLTLFDSDKDGTLVLTGQVDKNIAVAKMQRDVGQICLEFTALGHFQLFGTTGAALVGNPIALQTLAPELKSHLTKILDAENMRAIERIEAADGNLKITDLTAALGLADRQFRNDFKRLIGLTPKTFCKTLQINRAFNQLLMKNGGDLAEIAIKSGFADQAHFTRAFGTFLGKAPKSYLDGVEVTLQRFVGQSRP